LAKDEIDALAGSREGTSESGVTDRVLSQLLIELDGMNELKDVSIVAATNRPDIIDKALLRAGRFDRILYVGPPDVEARTEIFKIHLQKIPHEEQVSPSVLAEQTERFSGAEVALVCREASLLALEENIDIEKVKKTHFLQAISQIKPSITKEILQFYQKFQQTSGIQSVL